MSERQQILVPGTHATLALLQTVSEPDPPSISAVVRYSRVRTEEFTVVGADRPAVRFPTIFCPCSKVTSELSSISSLVSIGVVGTALPPLARSEPTRMVQRAGQLKSPEPPARESPRRPCHWHRCQSVRRDRGSGVLRINRGTAGALDRVAQIAERKYCRPQARPFGLGFPRKVPVFPICPPAAL